MNILNKDKILEAARAFIEEGKFDKAIREYEKILLADPSDMRVKLRVAELYTKRRQINDAIRIYREVADAYAAEGFYLKAVTVHKNILRLNPSLSDTNEQLALLYEKMGLMNDAVRQYDILASSLDLKGQKDRVIEIRNKIVRLVPKDGSARVKLAEIYQREGRMEEAIDQYEEYAKQVEESGGEKGKLADLFEKILAHRPEKHDMLRKLIYIYEDLGDHKKSLRCLEAGKSLVEGDAELLSLMARIYASQNQNETARSKYMALAELEAASGNGEAALDAYFEILVLLPDEEDRLARRVEELKAGALPEIALRARQRREEMEREEMKRQEEEAAKEASAGKAGKEETTEDGAAPSGKPPARTAQETRAPQAPQRQPEQAPAPSRAPAQKPEAKADRKAADAAFDLGLVYRRMGLSEEASAEFEKAREIYAACLAGGERDPDIAERLSQIEASEAGTRVRVEKNAEGREQKTEGGERKTEIGERGAGSMEQEARGGTEGVKPAEKKKKVSFV